MVCHNAARAKHGNNVWEVLFWLNIIHAKKKIEDGRWKEGNELKRCWIVIGWMLHMCFGFVIPVFYPHSSITFGIASAANVDAFFEGAAIKSYWDCRNFLKVIYASSYFCFCFQYCSYSNCLLFWCIFCTIRHNICIRTLFDSSLSIIAKCIQWLIKYYQIGYRYILNFTFFNNAVYIVVICK